MNTERPLNERLVGTLWVCECCYFAHCYGECGPDHPHDMEDYPEPLARTGGLELAAGMPYAEHEDDCLFNTMGADAPGSYECECETRSYSAWQCEGCGARYNGARYALTAWTVD